MRLAYIAPYQGPALIMRRPSRINLALAGNLKIELVAELLAERDHDVEILSQGEVVENRLAYFPAFDEPRPFSAEIPVSYASALPVRFMNAWWSSRRTLALFQERHESARFDLVLVYNLKPPQVSCAQHAMDRFELPVVVEFEDDLFVDVRGRDEDGFRARRHLPGARRRWITFGIRLPGCVAALAFAISGADSPPARPGSDQRRHTGTREARGGAEKE